jgi:type III secretion system low calcium response chaperone LcrH/SycD
MNAATKTGDISQELIGMVLAGMEKCGVVGDAVGLSAEALEAGYVLAYNFYSAGNYADAEKLFCALCIYDHKDTRFWMGLGGCRQAAGNLTGAIDAYCMTTIISALDDPVPLVHGGLCYLKLGDAANAAALFEAALESGKADGPAREKYREQAKALLELARSKAKDGDTPETDG